MIQRQPDFRDPATHDVLAPFVEEWAERARQAQAAIDALTSGAAASRAPRVERRRIGKRTRYTLVRRDGDEQRLLYGPDAKEVTVNFTDAEWTMISQVILLQHGLTPLPLPSTEGDDQEGNA